MFKGGEEEKKGEEEKTNLVAIKKAKLTKYTVKY
jgi:hypothetical protein